jgi:shikimate kinase
MTSSSAHRIPNLVLVGFMGTGKSSVGRACASTLGYPYHDSDQWVARRAGMPIPQIFETEGEVGFRAREREAIRHLTVRSAIVLSTGGGAVLDPENAALLRESGLVVLLTAEVDEILARVGHSSGRPLLQSDDPRARIVSLLESREAAYREAAHSVVDTTGRLRDDVAREVVSLYRAYGQ